MQRTELARTIALVLALSLSLIGAQSRAGDDSRSAGPDGSRDSSADFYDCGTIALYTFLRLNGMPTKLSTLETRLSSPHPEGYSMLELRNAARSCGLNCDGVRMPKNDRQPASAILAFLRLGGHGHFVVVRPIGHTGKLVQVLNLNRSPEVLDAIDLYSSPEWTGLALIPSRPNWLSRIGWALGAGSLAIGFGGWLAKHGRRGRGQTLEQPHDALPAGE